MKVDATAVEQELARMQRELTNSEVRTSLFNLVVMSPDAQRAMVDEALNYLLGKRAARVIHIVNNNDEESNLEVSARCFVDHEHKGVCFQEVVITNGTDDAGGAPGSWIPLLVRDIPTYVLWLNTVDASEHLFTHVQNQADKIIVDSDHCVELGDDPESLLTTLRHVAVDQGVPLSDFSWKRLRPFQRLTAAAFEGGGREAWLNDVAEVEIRGLARVAGELFGLWLAERLGWTRLGSGPADDPYASSIASSDATSRSTGTAGANAGNQSQAMQESGRAVARYRDVRGRSVMVACEFDAPDGCDVEILVRLTDGRVVEVNAGRNGCADVEYPGGAEQHVVTIPSNGEILLEEVDAVYADDLYRDALARFR